MAVDRRPLHGDPPLRVAVDRVRRGAVARRRPDGSVRRAEPGPHGPLLLEAAVVGGRLHCTVWGDAATDPSTVEAALRRVRAWTGQDDRPEALADAVADHPLLRRLLRELGEVRLGRLPRVFEAVGRAVVHQLVQSGEAVRSVAQMVERYGDAAAGGVTTWPTAGRLGATPAWELRRCGVSLRGARALHAAAVDEPGLERCGTDMAALDRRLRVLPGVGVWTSAETRLALGDPDAVSVGDYHLHTWVSWVLAGVPPEASSDAMMLELLAPYSGQRGRVVTLIGRAIARGLVSGPPRQAPHAAWSQHRYW